MLMHSNAYVAVNPAEIGKAQVISGISLGSFIRKSFPYLEKQYVLDIDFIFPSFMEQ